MLHEKSTWHIADCKRMDYLLMDTDISYATKRLWHTDNLPSPAPTFPIHPIGEIVYLKYYEEYLV